MGTRSDIIVHLASGKWHRIYCHLDSYLEGAGRTLFDHYTSQKQVEKLVALGDLSSLGEIIGTKHSFDWRDKLYRKYKKRFPADYTAMRKDPQFIRYNRMCLAYGRDRDETDVAGTVGESLFEVWPPEDTWTEFTYVWDYDELGDGKWYATSPDEGTQTLLDLGDLLMDKRTLKPAVKAFGMTIGQHAALNPRAPRHSWSR